MKRLRPDNPNTDTTLAWRAFEAGGCVLPQTDWPRLEALVKYWDGCGRYLDVGCGASPMPLRLAFTYPDAEIWAIDHCDELMDHLDERFTGVQYRSFPRLETALPFADNYIDYLVAGELLEHLDEPSLFISECFRVLTPGGCLALSTPCSESVRYGRVSHEHVWSFEGPDIQAILEVAGFEQVETELFKEDSFPIIMAYGRKP